MNRYNLVFLYWFLGEPFDRFCRAYVERQAIPSPYTTPSHACRSTFEYRINSNLYILSILVC